MPKSAVTKFEPLDKDISDRFIRSFKYLAEQEYNGEITLKKFESESVKLAHNLQSVLLKKNGIEDNVQITKEILEAGKSRNGSWSDKQIQVLGSTKKKNKGWYKELLKKKVTQHQVDRFSELKDAHLK